MLGTVLGWLLGLADGIVLGRGLGPNEGAVDCTKEGVIDGLSVLNIGDLEGARDGRTDGMDKRLVGVPDGTILGLNVGIQLGTLEGSFEGATVGPLLGLTVGNGLGTDEGSGEGMLVGLGVGP